MSSILIVDDDIEIRKTLRLLLAGSGVLLEASNGPDALRRIKAEKPSLMLLDIAMPEMPGLEVLRSALDLSPNLIVIMLTGEADIAIAKEALDLGARSYITKPFDGAGLRAEVEHIISRFEGDGAPAPYKPWRVA